MGSQAGLAMALLTVAVGCSGFIYAGEQSAMLDIANNFAGTLMGTAVNEPSRSFIVPEGQKEASSGNFKPSRRFVDKFVLGVINALGNTMGFVAPMIVGLLINGHNDVAHWQVVNSVALVMNITINLLTVGSVLDSGRGEHIRNYHFHYLWIC